MVFMSRNNVLINFLLQQNYCFGHALIPIENELKRKCTRTILKVFVSKTFFF